MCVFVCVFVYVAFHNVENLDFCETLYQVSSCTRQRDMSSSSIGKEKMIFLFYSVSTSDISGSGCTAISALESFLHWSGSRLESPFPLPFVNNVQGIAQNG